MFAVRKLLKSINKFIQLLRVFGWIKVTCVDIGNPSILKMKKCKLFSESIKTFKTFFLYKPEAIACRVDLSTAWGNFLLAKAKLDRTLA